MVSFLWVVSGLLVLQGCFVLWNLSQLPDVAKLGAAAPDREPSRSIRSGAAAPGARDDYASAGGSPKQKPLVSVLVPARDEERNLPGCLASVLSQQGVPLELLVLDDRSTDRTALLARGFALRDPRVRLIHGAELPEGWTGKAFACHQLAAEASGEWLLFLDADARLAEGAVARLLQAAQTAGRGLLTGFPRQVVGTRLEKWIVPLMMFTVACHLPIRFVRASRKPEFAAAHGACMLIHREAYDETGGHAAVRDRLVEDVELARKVKRTGRPLLLADVHREVYMRMYRSAGEVWRGYRKNIYPGLGRRPELLLALVAVYAVLYVFPGLSALSASAIWLGRALAAAAGWYGGDVLSPRLIPGFFLPGLAGYLLGSLIKSKVDRKNGLSWRLGWTLPVGIGCLLVLAVDSWRFSRQGKGYEWKGRRYG